MRFPHGDVAADFRPTGPREKRHATYELRVANDTASPLATFAYALAPPSECQRISWSAIVVPPHSAIAVEIDIPLPRRGRLPRIIAELYTEQAQLTLDAPPPRNRRRLPRRSALAAAAVLLLALGVGSVAQTQARVLALAAPASVRGGTPFSVAYALAQTSQGSYVVETPDGMQVRRGTLDARSGAFTVALPQTPVSSGYDVRVSVHSRFGTDERTTHVVAVPEPPSRPKLAARSAPRAPAVRLGALTLQRDVVHGGESIVVDYRATSNAGTVRLIDAFGTVRAEALLNRRGRSIIVAPQVDADQDFRIVANVEHGAAHDEVATAVTILYGPPALTSAAAVQQKAVAAPRSAAPIAVDPLQIAGKPIVVRIDHSETAMRVALLGPGSAEIVGVDVAPSDASVVLTPPDGLAPSRYSVVATYSAGLGQETLIRPITLRAP